MDEPMKLIEEEKVKLMKANGLQAQCVPSIPPFHQMV